MDGKTTLDVSLSTPTLISDTGRKANKQSWLVTP